MNRTTIEWTTALPGVPGYSWNPVHGCTKISPACEHCYAARTAPRLAGMGVPGYAQEDPFRVVCMEERAEEPHRYTVGGIVFVVSMGDWLHKDVPDWFVGKLLRTMQDASQHFFLTLTKRADRLPELPRIAKRHGDLEKWPLPNVGIGVTMESQEQEERVVQLLRIDAALRFVSVEPMLGEVGLWRLKCGHEYDGEGADYYNALSGSSFWPNGDHGIGGGPTVDWVLCGGESGPGARPMHPDWARDMRDQCREAGTAFLWKQWGEYRPVGGRDDFVGMERVGKKAAGRLLDGVEHNEVPLVIRQHFGVA
jgi:protein gp37